MFNMKIEDSKQVYRFIVTIGLKLIKLVFIYSFLVNFNYRQYYLAVFL